MSLLKLLLAASSKNASLQTPLQAQQWRFLNVHEYQGAALMSKFGINTPPGTPAFSVDDVTKAAKHWADENGEVVLKSQILAGGRGLGKFTSGLQGGVHMVTVAQAPVLAEQMLGSVLVTKQTGPAGKPVNTLYVAQKMKLVREMYFAILLDRKSAGPIMIGCSQGGTSIEDLAEKFPDKIVKIPIDIRVGCTDAQALAMATGLAVTGDKEAAAQQIKALYELFVKTDCTMVEVNPLAEDPSGKLIAADAKLAFDDNAAYRQADIFAMKDDSQIDSRSVLSPVWNNLNYVTMDGTIGCMVNGAGLAMATMDVIKLAGGEPANFLDVGGGATKERVTEAFKLILSSDKVRAILVNIFGGIVRCDLIAEGIIAAVKEVGLKIPVIVRLQGTNVDQGRELLANSGLAITPADDLNDAAYKAVAAANILSHAGGIMKCDVIAAGIVNAAKQVNIKVPLIVRLEGTNVERGKEILRTSGLAIIPAEDLDDAAKQAVKSITKA
ncbi:MAG: hypothetical protein WDW38_002843 [Sanguina aurantia]